MAEVVTPSSSLPGPAPSVFFPSRVLSLNPSLENPLGRGRQATSDALDWPGYPQPSITSVSHTIGAVEVASSGFWIIAVPNWKAEAE